MRELILTPLGGIQYGILKDETLTVRAAHALSRLPLSPPTIAGFMIEDGRTVTLDDLAACLGYQPSPAGEQGHILHIEKDGRVTGFVVNGELHTLSVHDGQILPLPAYLATKVIASCVILDGLAVPLIDIAALYEQVLKGDEGAAAVPLAVQDTGGQAASRIWRVTAGGEAFAISAEGVAERALRPGRITPLPHTPPYVKGVTFQDGRLLPVVDIAQRIKRQDAAPDPSMLITTIGDTSFALLVDRDGGTWPGDEVEIKPLPMIAQSHCLREAVVRAGEIIPLIDLPRALSPALGACDEKPVWQRYVPDPGFRERFAGGDVEIVEFSLLGERYALPGDEVEDDIAFREGRAIPDAPHIVIGVAEHSGELLPVLDLARMFGRRSLSTPDWRLMVVKNGDFRALVLAASVSGARLLPREMHRAVPIHLPHDLMYGCYPDAQAVRLILNVEAIAVHFERSMIQRFLPALTNEMKMSSTGKMLAFTEERTGSAEPVAAVDAAEPGGEAPEQFDVPDVVGASVTQTALPEDIQADEAAASAHEYLSSAGEARLDDEWDQGDVYQAAAVAEEMAMPGAIDASAVRMDKDVEEHDAAERPPFDAGIRPARSVSTGEPPLEVEYVESLSGQRAQPVGGVWKRRASYGAVLAAVLIAVFYSLPDAQPPAVGPVAREAGPAATGPGKELGPRVMTEQASAKTGATGAKKLKPHPTAKVRPTLEIKIPASMPFSSGLYVVQEGDTLWSISQRFTGDPYNFPRIAGNNRIADPDLIFPGQQIRLIK